LARSACRDDGVFRAARHRQAEAGRHGGGVRRRGRRGQRRGADREIKECRVIGIAGGADKCRYLMDELGFDAAIDYKAEDVKDALKRHCPKGIDVYFDNVGRRDPGRPRSRASRSTHAS
jgi:hypothetical protein